jgi:hypothetical protein
VGDVVPLRDVFGRLTRLAPPHKPGGIDSMLTALPLPVQPPITREHHLEAALLIVQSDLETIESALDIEPTSTPTHIPPSVAEALYRALRTIAKVKS